MRVIKAVSALVMLVLVAVVATVEADDKKASTEPVWVNGSTTMPAIDVSNQPLEKILDEIKSTFPNFHFTIARENVPHDYPVLPNETLENVSIDQFLRLVSEQIPGVTVTESYAADCIYCDVEVKPNPNVPKPPELTVRIFGLADTFAGPAISGANAEIEKQGINDALSLIQAALDVAGENPPAVLKVHTPTKSLIFKGTEAQSEIVANAIAVLKASAKSRIYELPEGSKILDELKKRRDAATKPAK